MFDRGILPQLAIPAYVRLIVSKPPRPPKEPAPSLEGQRIRDRKARKRASRLARAIAGEHTRSPNATRVA